MTTRAENMLLSLLDGYGISDGDYLTSGDIYYVDSGASGAGDNASNGSSWDSPFATLDYAVSQCTASNGDVIYVAPGHAETIDTTTDLALDVAGVTVIGLGVGSLRPTFSIGAAGDDTPIITISAANIYLKNLIFKPVAVDTAVLVDIAGVAGCKLEDCLFDMDIGSYEAVIGLDIGASDDTVVKNCEFLSTGSAGATAAISVTGTADNLRIQGCNIQGDWGSAGIYSDQAFTNALITDNFVSNTHTEAHAIELSGAATGLLGNNRLYADTAGLILDPGSLKCLGNMAVSAINEGGVPIPAVAGVDVAAGGGGDLPGGVGTSAGDEWYVDSGASGNASGKSWANAVTKLDTAINLCAEGNGDVIYLAPGHAENLSGAETVDIDVAGITIIGVGNGASIPTFSTTVQAGCIKIDDHSTTIRNIKVIGNYDGGSTAGISITGNGDDTLIEDCWFAETSSSRELLIMINAAADADRVTIRNNKFIGVSGGSSTNAIVFAGATDESVIEGNYFWGDWSDYVVDGAASAGTMLLIKDNVIHNVDTGAGLTIGLHASSTGTVVGNRCYGAKAGVGIVCLGTANVDNLVVNAVNTAARNEQTPIDRKPLLTSGRTFYVDSTHANAADATGAGYSWELPCATVDYAVGLCTHDSGDVIYVAAGHAEALSAASGVDVDVRGVKIIGLGHGETRPLFTFDTDADADFKLAEDSTWIENLVFKAGVDALTGPIEVTGTDCMIKDCEWQDVAGSYQATDVIVTVNDADRLTIDGYRHLGDSAAGADSAIALIGADDCVIKNCEIYGNFAVGAIDCRTTASNRIRIHDCQIWTENGDADIAIVDTVTASTGIMGPNIFMVLQDDAANITTAITGTTFTVMDVGVHVVNAVNEKSIAINWDASTDA